MNEKPSAYLLVIGEREALAWILRERRMAFPATSRREVSELKPGDKLFLTTTRSCFHNPTRDATRVVAVGDVRTDVTPLATPVVIAGREFTRECEIGIEVLAPYLAGVELATLVDELDAFVGSPAWGMRLRRPLLAVSRRDARTLERRLRKIASDPVESEPAYFERIRPVATVTRSALKEPGNVAQAGVGARRLR